MEFESNLRALVVPRLRAAGTHLLVCLVVAFALVTLVTQVCYPAPLFDLVQGRDIFFLIVGCDITLGPAMTLIVFNIRKPRKELVRDIGIIACVQLAALSYGVYALAQVRPVYIVFNVARFNVTLANELVAGDPQSDTNSSIPSASWTGPRLVGAKLPVNPHEKSDMIFSAVSGHGDVFQMPRYFVAYQDVKPQVIARAQTVDQISKVLLVDPKMVERATASYRQAGIPFGLLPLVIRQTTALAVVDTKSGDLLGIEPIPRVL